MHEHAHESRIMIRTFAVRLALCLPTVAGCADPGERPVFSAAAGASAPAGSAAGASAGAGAPGGTGETMRPLEGAPGPTGRASLGTTALPCAVDAVLDRRCRSCHGAAPLASVPMALVTLEDLQAPAVSRPEVRVHELAAMRVHDSARPMPPNVPLPAEELATLDAWFGRGAAAGEACAPKPTPDGGVVAPPGPPPGSTCYTLRAHGAPVPNDTSPWVVANQHYACFYFDAPWPDDAQGVWFEPAFDEHANRVHHWILYLDENGNQPDGHVETCSGLHPTGPTMVAGWAPGSDNNALPEDVGMHLSPANRKILLEMHFFHDGLSAPIETTSGVEVCTANTPRPHTATISLLGSEAIALAPGTTGEASGSCTPQSNEEIHILRSWPHMHEMGHEMETTILRADGTTELLGVWPFDFNAQVSWPTPARVRPGDRLLTTCRYINTSDRLVSVGQDTQSEMCFNFVTAYPANALMSRNLLGGSTSATSSATACLE